MRIIARPALVAYGMRNPEAQAPLAHWERVVRAADWATASEVTSSFRNAKVLNAERVRFEVAGGRHRLIVAFDYGRKIAFIKFLGTHAEYDRVDAKTVALF